MTPGKPISEKQLEANRRNARHSTGPVTPEGRAVSRLNAYKHGLTGHLDVMTDEQKQARDAFITELATDLKPVGPFECQLAHSIAELQWRLNRVAVIENNMFTADAYHQEIELPTEVQQPDVDLACASARTFIKNPERFQLLTVYEMRLHRRLQSEIRQFRGIQSARAAEAERQRAEAERQKAAEEKQKAETEVRRSAALQEAAWLLNLEEEEGKTIEPAGVFRHRNGFVFSNSAILEAIGYSARLTSAKACYNRQIDEIRRNAA